MGLDQYLPTLTSNDTVTRYGETSTPRHLSHPPRHIPLLSLSPLLSHTYDVSGQQGSQKHAMRNVLQDEKDVAFMHGRIPKRRRLSVCWRTCISGLRAQKPVESGIILPSSVVSSGTQSFLGLC